MKHHRRRRTRFIIPVVSMGDIAFLLIIFFMMCSHFAKERKITPAESDYIDELKRPRPPTIVVVEADGTIYFQGAPTSGADEVESLVSQIITDDAPPDRRRVQLSVDASVGPEVYKPLLEALGRAGATIEFVGQPRGAGGGGP